MELSKAPNSQNGHSLTWPLLCYHLGTSLDVASYRHNAHKIEEVSPCDFQVSLTCLRIFKPFSHVWPKRRCHGELSDEPLDT